MLSWASQANTQRNFDWIIKKGGKLLFFRTKIGNSPEAIRGGINVNKRQQDDKM